MTPIDTVREALERVEAAQSAVPDLGIGAHDQESDVRYGKLSSLADTGRDLLEALEKHGLVSEPLGWSWHPLAVDFAQSYARRVGEVTHG